jgi:WD40 repeat protein/transcriptional regulator with XRE-family HTH domain
VASQLRITSHGFAPVGHAERSVPMEKSSYGQRDYAFGQAMLTLRTSIGLTQAQLAEHLGVSRKAVGDWEAGESYPRASHLKHFIMLGVRASAFADGQEAEEVRALWQAARQKMRLDERWLSTLLSQQPRPGRLLVFPPVEQAPGPAPLLAPAAGGPRVDWGEALAVQTFYGREGELATLCQWVLQERCRVVSVLGMGGIGKSALVTSAMYQLADHFQVVIFRSLRDAPSCEALLADCLQVLAPEPVGSGPQSLQHRLSLLLEHLRNTRVLLVLDNLEALLSGGDVRGHLRPGLEGYAQLLRGIAQTAHQSCLLLTSREKPAELRQLEGSRTPVRALRLAALDAGACEQLLAEHEVAGSQEERARLIEVYVGNPLALKIVAETIADLFGGAIGPFLAEGTVVFGTLVDLLEEQAGRLSALEQTVLYWLAIVREPLTLQELLALLVGKPERRQVLEALDSLRRHCLIEPGQRLGSFTLHSVVLEYVTANLVEQASGEIQQGRLSRLREHGLCQAHAKEYVWQTQQRLLLSPLLARLQRAYQGAAGVEKQVCMLLDQLREEAQEAQGYGPANLMALLRLIRGDLRGLDLSRLALRGVHLQGVQMQDATLAGAMLQDSVFTETFDAISAVAISRTGQYWAAGSKRGEVRVWKEVGQTLHLLWQAHTERVIALTFSPDEGSLLSASWDGSIKRWDLHTGSLLWTGWHTKSVHTLAFAPDGSLLASSGKDASLLWDLQRGTPLETLPHPAPMYMLSWGPDGRWLASGSSDGGIRVWERHPSGPTTCVQTIPGHSSWVRGLAFAPDGRLLASASWNGTVKLWEVGQEGSLRLRHTLTGHTDRVLPLVWSPDGRTLASGGRDSTIRLWEVEEGCSRAALSGHTAEVTCLAFTPEGRSLLSGSEDGTLRVWDVERGQCLRIMQGYATFLYDIAWSPDGTQVISGGSDTLVSVWETDGQTPPRTLRGHSWAVCGVGWSPDGRLVASSGWDNTLCLWDPTSGACLARQRDPDYPYTNFFGAAWSPDGQQLASGAYLHGVLVWEVTAQRTRWIGRQLPSWMRCVAWSPDGTRLVGGGNDGSVYLWDAADGTLLERLVGHHGVVMSVAWSPDGKWLASGGGSRDGGELVVWDAHNAACVRVLVEHPGVVYAVTWAPNGELVVSGGSDGRLRWWEVHSGACVLVREAHQGRVHALRISPDGHRLASCGDDGAITIWDLHSGQYLRTLRRDRPYERLNITGIRGLTEAQKATLRALGAREESAGPL